MKNLIDPNFWFAAPSLDLIHSDKILFYIAIAAMVLGIIFAIWTRLSLDPIWKKVLMRLDHLGLTTGLLGIFWFGFRYENTPVFSYRYWVGLVGLAGLVWLGFILWYLIFTLPKEKAAYNREMQNRKYMPQGR